MFLLNFFGFPHDFMRVLQHIANIYHRWLLLLGFIVAFFVSVKIGQSLFMIGQVLEIFPDITM